LSQDAEDAADPEAAPDDRPSGCSMTARRKKATIKKKSKHLPKAKKRAEGERLKPISLHPLSFDAAMRRLVTRTPPKD